MFSYLLGTILIDKTLKSENQKDDENGNENDKTLMLSKDENQNENDKTLITS